MARPIVILGFLTIGLLFVFGALVCPVNAQTYAVGDDAPKDPIARTDATKSTEQPLGWGSNIQNARLARAAQLALQHGNHALAFDYAQRAATAAPNDPQLWFLFGYAARLNGKLQQSVDAYTKGLHLSPSSLDGLSGLGQAYSLMGRTEDAKRLLKQVVSSDPKRKDDALMLGELYMKSAEYTDAVDWLGKAERIHPDARSELLMALAYQRMKQMDIASHYLDLAKRRAPNDPDVERSLAGYYREIGKYSEAIAALKSIRNPRPDLMAELAYTYQLDGKLDDSARLYGQAANIMPKDLALQLSAAQAEVAVGSIERANAFLQRATGIDANSYRLHAIRGEIAKFREDEQDAIREYTIALANLPANPVEGELYGIQLHLDLMEADRSLTDEPAARHQLEIAQSELNKLDDHGPRRVQLLRLRARIKMNAGDLDSALSDSTAALSINTQDPDELQLNGDILMKLGRTEDAINTYKRIIVIDAGNQYALTSLGSASRAMGRDQDAEKYFRRLSKAFPSLYVPYLALGDLYTARGDFTAAQTSYSKAYSLAPQKALIVAGGINAAIEAHDMSVARVWMNHATVQMDKEPQILREKERYLSFEGQYQKSAEIGRAAIKVLPRDRDVVVYLGYDLFHLQEYSELLGLMSQYLDVFPKEPDIPLLTGYVHLQEGRHEQALQDFTEALNRDPNVVTAYVNRGYVFNSLNKPEAGAADFESALKREPNNGEAHLGLAYSSLDLNKPQAALRQTELAEKSMGDSKNVHVIRATAYERGNQLTKAATEYRAALKFTPDDAALHLGLGNTLFAERQYHEAIDELQLASRVSPESADVYALLARCFANLSDRDQTLQYVRLAEKHAQQSSGVASTPGSGTSDIFVTTGEALSTLGDQTEAMERFRMALTLPHSNRVRVRLAIARVMAVKGHSEDAERQVALAVMESEAAVTAAPTGREFISAADVFRIMHEYELSQTYLDFAKRAGAPDAEVRLGMANNYLALGDTMRAQAQISAISVVADNAPDYQYLLAKANVLRQQHHSEQALTSFAQASNAGGEDQTAEQSMLQAGADEGLRVAPVVSLLSDISVEPVFEDSTVYVLDAKLDGPTPVSSSDTDHLPPPRSSIATQATNAYHLHLGNLPTVGGFFQVRNSQGLISVPSTDSIVDRNTTDYSINVGLNPTLRFGRNAVTFNSGVQGTVRRDTTSPVEMNQNLARVFTYVDTSSFFNAVSVSGYVIRESGPFTDSNLRSRALTGAIEFRVGAPWGKTTLVTGWGANDQRFSPGNRENFYTSSYLGIERKFLDRLNIRAVAEDLRAWRVVGPKSAIAQVLRPAGTIEFIPRRNWYIRASTAYSSTRGFHVYDAMQSGFSVSYARPFHRSFNDGSGKVVLQYPIRFSAGLQVDSFFNFKGGESQQLRPYVRISLF